MNTDRIAALLDNAAIGGIYVNRNNDGTLTIGSQSRHDSVSKLARVQHILAINNYRATWHGRVVHVKG